MERLDANAIKRVSGPSWSALRPPFEQISAALLDVSESARGELTTIYVKYFAKETGDQPYAVVWLKKSTELVVGLALPEGYASAQLEPPPKGCKYANLTSYLSVKPEDSVPQDFAQWARDAFNNLKVS